MRGQIMFRQACCLSSVTPVKAQGHADYLIEDELIHHPNLPDGM